MADKYLSIKKFVNGFSFANLGFFTGFGGGIISAVYALVLMDIFQNSAAVGIYFAIYNGFCMLITLFSASFFRYFTKARLFYASMLSIAVIYFMMAFSIKPATFITLDFLSGIPLVLTGLTIPLFLAEFSKNIGLSKLNGRYQFWINVGALFSPIIAMAIANQFGNRSAFFAVALVYFCGFLFYKFFGVKAQDKKLHKLNARKTLRATWKDLKSYFSRADLTRSYFIEFGFSAMKAMRLLYVPIVVIEQGFSKETLGLILTLGVIPYILFSELLGGLVKKYGSKLWMIIGFVSFSALAFWAALASGWTLLMIFVLWQISGAILDSVDDLLFFNATKKSERSKFIGIFNTASNIPKFIAPLLGAGFIAFFGGTFAVWIMTGIIGIISTYILIRPHKN